MERVLQLIARVGGIEAIAPDAKISQAGFSSARVLELLLSLEEEFGISIPDEDFIIAETPRQIAVLIEQLSQRQAA